MNVFFNFAIWIERTAVILYLVNYLILMVMKKILFICICFFVLMSSCDNESVGGNLADNDNEIIGVTEYLGAVMPDLMFMKQLSENMEITTRSQITELDNNVELKQSVRNLIRESKEFLELNGVIVSDYFDNENDLRIGLAGLALMQYNNLYSTTVTRGAGSSIDYAADCLLKAAGVSGLAKKSVAKIIAKTASKLVPYVGVTLFTVELAACLFK